MGIEWELVSLGQIAEIGSSKRIKMSDYVSAGVPFFRSKEIIEKHKGNDISTELFISHEQFNEIEKKFGAPQEGDILLTSVGTLGVPYQVKKHDKFYFKDGNLTWFRNFKKNVNSRFIYYWLTSAEAKKKFDEVTIGSTQQALTIVALKSIQILLPPLHIQNAIVWLLDSVSNKITLNRQINQTLEQMAQTLFKSWFVDFDPVIDNALDAGNDIPDTLQERADQRRLLRTKADFKPLPAETRVLFPSEFEESELGWVPKGWEYHALSEICRELKRGISPKYTETDGVCVINQKCIRNHEIDFSLVRRNDVALKKINGYELEIGDVVVNSTGVGTLGRLAQVKYLPETTVFDSHVTLLRAREEFVPKFFFGQLIQLEEKKIEGLGEGSTGQTELSRKILGEQRVLVPPLSVSNKVEKMLVDYASSYVSNTLQTQSLTQLRDVLLPKLISGELELDALPETPALAEAL